MMLDTTPIEDCYIIHSKQYPDHRGSFDEFFNAAHFRSAGLPYTFVQTNISHNYPNVLRGLHIMRANPQGKLIRCLKGAIIDIVLDLRPNSPSFLQTLTFRLDDHRAKALFVPPGCAHGFYSLETSIFIYHCTTLWQQSLDGGVRWSDPALKLNLPCIAPIVSPKDQQLPLLSEYLNERT